MVSRNESLFEEMTLVLKIWLTKEKGVLHP
jgi:hypothetical protein